MGEPGLAPGSLFQIRYRMSNGKRILVLGVGNILYTDEGLGVRAVERLQEQYDFSDNVTLMDGGTLGIKLMDSMMDSDYLIVVDAVLGGSDPASVYRLTGEDLRKSLGFNDSMHQTDLVDTLIYCELAGNRPEAVVIGMEPVDYQSMGLEVSPPVLERIPAMCKFVLDEVTGAGGSYSPKAS